LGGGVKVQGAIGSNGGGGGIGMAGT
jgi:hypothetical protein